MIATDMTTSGAPEEKLCWAFKMYDRDGSGTDDVFVVGLSGWCSGTIEIGEMVEIIETLCKMEEAGDEASYQDIYLWMIFCCRIV